METKHTPGPWRTRGTFSFDHEVVREIWSAPDATGHSELVAMIPAADGDHINADARLVAAAPELLYSLRDAYLTMHLMLLALPQNHAQMPTITAQMEGIRELLGRVLGVEL